MRAHGEEPSEVEHNEPILVVPEDGAFASKSIIHL